MAESISKVNLGLAILAGRTEQSIASSVRGKHAFATLILDAVQFGSFQL